MHRAILILAATLAPALWACCPFDPDTLAAEAASMPGMMDLLSGKIGRLPPRHYMNQLEAALKAMKAEPGNFEHARRAAEAQDMLMQPQEGVSLLRGFADAKLSVSERTLRDGLLARLHIHQWLLEQDPAPGTAQNALEASRTGPANRLLSKLLEWASQRPAVRADEMLPDYFGLRLAANKTALADNDQLKTMNLADVPEFLGYLLKLHPLWENVDTYYCLSLTLGVLGKQTLAHVARLRVYELLDQGKSTRLDIPADVKDLRALLIPRHMKAGALVEIPTLSDDFKKQIAVEFASRREDARRWRVARETFATKKMEVGKSPDSDAAFWQDFAYSPVGLAVAATNPPTGDPALPADKSKPDTVVIISSAVAVVVVIGVMGTIRRKRKPPAAPGPDQKA